MIHDRTLIERIEASIQALLESYVDAQREQYPGTSAECVGSGATFALVDGAGLESQISGFGDSASPDASRLDGLITWMRDRLAAAPLAGQSTIRCVLGPLAAASHAQRLTDRGASYGGVSNLLTLDLAGYSPTKPDPRISLGAGEERFVPGETIVRAVSGGDADPRGLMVANSYSAIPWMDHFLVRVDGEPAGGGALAIRDGLAFLTGTAVLPAFRGQHLQTALIQHRLSVAKAAGCKVAFVTCDVASLSQRNLERSGFRAAYPRISLKLPVADSGRP